MAPLACPSCGAPHPADERFCRDCGLPLVYGPGVGDGGRPLSGSRERARKVRPQFAEGPLVRVATARNQAEAEMLEGLLLEEGIPSLVRRSGGFDVPDFLASGPRELLVPAAGAELAREVLGPVGPLEPRRSGEGTPAWVKVLAVVVSVGILALIAASVVAAVLP